MLNNGESYGPEKERERMLDETIIAVSLDKLREVGSFLLSHLLYFPFTCFPLPMSFRFHLSIHL